MNEHDDFDLWRKELAAHLFQELPATDRVYVVALKIVMSEVTKELGWSQTDCADLMMIYLEAARQMLEGDHDGAEQYRKNALRELREKIARR